MPANAIKVDSTVAFKSAKSVERKANAQTELSFRQALGRVVRSAGKNDDSSAYVVMPTHNIFEEYV